MIRFATFFLCAFIYVTLFERRVVGSDFFFVLERERVDEAIRRGNYDEALRNATVLEDEYRKAWSQASQMQRNQGRNRFQYYKAVIDAGLADACRYCGRYEDAKGKYKAANKSFEELTRREFAAFCLKEGVRQSFEQWFLAAWDRGTIQGMYNAKRGAELAGDGAANSMRWLLDFAGRRAVCLDCYGSMEMDCGNLDEAERLFNEGLKVRESIGGEKLDAVVEPHNRVYGTVARNFGRLFLKRGEQLYGNGGFSEARGYFDRADHYFRKAEDLFSAARVQPSEQVSSSAGTENYERMEQQLAWMAMRTADLQFNRAEWAMAMAVYDAEQASGDQVNDFLDQADQLLSEASDKVEEFLETRDHPNLIYCWADLAGVAARRGVLLRQPLDEEALAYLEKAEDLMKKRNLPENAPQAGVIAKERVWVQRAAGKAEAAAVQR